MVWLENLLGSGEQTLDLVVWSIYIGIALACVLALYEKRLIGKFVRALLNAGATAPEKALLLQELGMEKNAFVRSALQRKTALSSLVFTPEEQPEIGEDLSVRPAIRGKINFETTRFYIPDRLQHRAFVRYDQRGTHVMGLVVALLAFGLLGYGIVQYFPTLLQLLRQLFGIG